MPNEISLTTNTTGLSGLYARTLSGVTLGSTISLAEVSGSGGVYVGTMTGSAGDYVLLAYDSTDDLIGSSAESYRWNGTEFVGATSGDGLTAQQVRDALKLAPSAGSPAAGSVDADLDAIQGATFDPTTDSLEAISERAETIDKTGTKTLRRRD